MGIGGIEVLKGEPEKPRGAWIVYQQDVGVEITAPFPLFLSDNEKTARGYLKAVGPGHHIKFWIFNEEFGTRGPATGCWLL